MDNIIWSPTETLIQKSNIYRLMQRHRIASYADLITWSTSDIGRFWNAVMVDLDIQWDTPYESVLDASEGLPWTKWFIGGRTNIVTNCLDRHIRSRSNDAALIWEGEDKRIRTVTYRELNREVCRLAHALQKEGINKGDTVGIYMPMTIEMVAVFYASLKVGAICIPTFSGFSVGPLSARLRHADTKILFTADGSLRRGKTIEIKRSADEAADNVSSLKCIVVLRRLGNKIQWNPDRDAWYHDFIARGSAGPATTLPVEAETPALILYTSGTTGPPKGCVHSHGGCIAQVGKELAYHFDVKPYDRFFWLTDIGWMMGPWMLIGVHLQGGAVFLYEGAPNHPGPDRLWDMIDRHQITHLGISPTAIRVLMRAGDKPVTRHTLSSLRLLGSTGEPWDDKSYLWYFEKIGKKRIPIINISGGTEIIGCFLAPLPITSLKPSTLRGPGLGMDIDVFDDAGNAIKGTTGHLVCKQSAPSMTRGFWKDPERYLSTYWSRWPDIWFHGDWASVDEDGYWFLHGRSDDTLNVAGCRVGPAEIESVLIALDCVSEAAVIGIPDTLKGTAIICFVVLKPGYPQNAKPLKAEIVRILGKTFRPNAIEFVSQLPKTRSAKIVRRLIRAKYLGKSLGDLSSIENPVSLEEISPKERPSTKLP